MPGTACRNRARRCSSEIFEEKEEDERMIAREELISQAAAAAGRIFGYAARGGTRMVLPAPALSSTFECHW